MRAVLAALAAIAALTAAPVPSAFAQQGPLPVDVARPLAAAVVDWDEYTGRFEAIERVELRARISGYLEEVLFQDGQLVEKGEALFRIDRRPFEARVARAEAELQAAEAEQSRADLDLERGQQLVRSSAVSESTLDTRRAAKSRADADVAIARAALREVMLDLEFTDVTAPFSGRISARRVDVGNLVSGGETVLAVLVSNDPIHLLFTASEADFLKYSRLGASGERASSRDAANRVEARLTDETGWPHKGHMDFVANELDPNSGTITGRAIFENADGLLTPGLFARLRLVGSGEYSALLIPDAAVLSDQSRKIVFVADAEGAVSVRVVTLGPLYRGLRVIRDGLDANDLVIVAGVQRARPGGQVTPQETTLAFPETAEVGDAPTSAAN